MKVLHVVAYFPPDRLGGVGEVVGHLHAELLRSGHESQVLTTGSRSGERDVKRIARGAVAFVLTLAQYATRVRDFDLVHCHHGDALLMLLAMRIRGIRTPVLATYHVGHRGMANAHRPYTLHFDEGGPPRRFGTGWRGLVYRHGLARVHRFTDWAVRKLADRASFISRSGALDVLGEVRGARAPVVHNAVPVPVDGWKLDAENDPELTDLLYVGTDGPRKRVYALPFVLESLRRDHPEACLRIVGVDEKRSPELAALFAERGLADAVRWEGVQPSEAVVPFYRASRVLVVPSIYEGLPMVILEAQSWGLPCVATRVSGHPEVIEDGVNGFLVEPDAPDRMAARCSMLLQDEALRSTMSRAARSVVEQRFGLERQCNGYLELYRRLTGE
ncbi:glycosyltransferase family 4 protein [Myxococcota bacterium]|nr:glycosyltransferase family 4 protein [Myxococcota bacterium]